MVMQILSLTETAAERVKLLLKKSDEPALGLRISIVTTGCSGSSYKMDFVTDSNLNPVDDVVTDHGVTVYIDRGASMHLLGTVMDYKTDGFSAGFSFDNPNVTGACGCGESFTFKTSNAEN